MFTEQQFKDICAKLDQITWREITNETVLHVGCRYWIATGFNSNDVHLCTLKEYKPGQRYWAYPSPNGYRDSDYTYSFGDATHYMPFWEPESPNYYEKGNI